MKAHHWWPFNHLFLDFTFPGRTIITNLPGIRKTFAFQGILTSWALITVDEWHSDKWTWSGFRFISSSIVRDHTAFSNIFNLVLLLLLWNDTCRDVQLCRTILVMKGIVSGHLGGHNCEVLSETSCVVNKIYSLFAARLRNSLFSLLFRTSHHVYVILHQNSWTNLWRVGSSHEPRLTGGVLFHLEFT